MIQDGDRLFGDGVHIAARIESLADAGDVCVSRSTHDQINNKLELNYGDLCAHKVKNIKEPVRVYKILLESARLLSHDNFPLRGCHVCRRGQNASIVS